MEVQSHVWGRVRKDDRRFLYVTVECRLRRNTACIRTHRSVPNARFSNPLPSCVDIRMFLIRFREHIFIFIMNRKGNCRSPCATGISCSRRHKGVRERGASEWRVVSDWDNDIMWAASEVWCGRSENPMQNYDMKGARIQRCISEFFGWNEIWE